MVDPRFDWADAAVEKLRTMWSAGKTAAEIERHFGAPCTRNAVIEKLHRLGLDGRRGRGDQVEACAAPAKALAPIGHRPSAPAAPEPSPAIKAPRQSIPAKEPSAFHVANKKAAAARVERFACEAVTAPADGVTLVDLKAGMCRWPKGDPREEHFRFCGAAKQRIDRPYCAYHASMAVTTREPAYG